MTLELDIIKERFMEYGLWSLVEDTSDDGDGKGDDLQLTKEGAEAVKMIIELVEEQLEDLNLGVAKVKEDLSNKISSYEL
jgi:hypothetical protein